PWPQSRARRTGEGRRRRPRRGAARPAHGVDDGGRSDRGLRVPAHPSERARAPGHARRHGGGAGGMIANLGTPLSVRPVVVAACCLVIALAAYGAPAKSLQAVRTREAISIDGRLGERAWASAPAASAFVQ